jgi:hypothetical protein
MTETPLKNEGEKKTLRIFLAESTLHKTTAPETQSARSKRQAREKILFPKIGRTLRGSKKPPQLLKHPAIF